MSRESIEELKARLLSDSEVQMMIRMRAYEVYLMRGGQPGGQAEDWFRAESEVLSFLIEEEKRRVLEEATEAQAETVAGLELVASATETGDPETSGGDWRPTRAAAPKKPTR